MDFVLLLKYDLKCPRSRNPRLKKSPIEGSAISVIDVKVADAVLSRGAEPSSMQMPIALSDLSLWPKPQVGVAKSKYGAH